MKMCTLFGRCGGCQIMDIPYAQQLELKTQRVQDALQRNVQPCVASPEVLGYRNKLQFPARREATGLGLGLYAVGSNKLVDIATCPVQCASSDAVYREVRRILQRSGIVAYDPRTHRGELRHLLIKSAVHVGEELVVLVTNDAPTTLVEWIAQEIMASCQGVRGVVHNAQTAPNNVVLGSEYTTLAGQGWIHEQMCGFTFKISAGSFFQINTLQAEQVYRTAMEFAGEAEVILDAYCGVGTLALLLSRQAKRVVGVEWVAQAVEDARDNARLNGVENTTFTQGAARMVEPADVVVLNPPRKGCDAELLEAIGHGGVRRVVYISCEPMSLARDVARLGELGYRVEVVQPFDMFPHTEHVECVVKLTKMHGSNTLYL